MLKLNLTSLLMLMLMLLITRSNAMAKMTTEGSLTDRPVTPVGNLESFKLGDSETQSYTVGRVSEGAVKRGKSLFKFKIFPRGVNKECFRAKSCTEKSKTKLKRDPYLSIKDKTREKFQKDPAPAGESYDTRCCCQFCCP